MDDQASPSITTLQGHVANLTNLVERVNTLRKIPALLLVPSTLTGSQLEQGFGQIYDLKSVVCGDATQECLKQAYESFSKSGDNVSLDERRLNRKRRRPPSPTPESPCAPPDLPHRIFPPTSRILPLTLSELPTYIREHNRLNVTLKLHIWTPTKPSLRTDVAKTNPSQTILRICIRDVLYAYVKLGVVSIVDHIEDCDRMEEDSHEGKLIIESVSVFGPRERKSRHSQSDYAVFQQLSQYVASMIQAEPDVDLPSFISLFKSYESLFVAQCAVCHRILSEEGHFPPVCRIWNPVRRPRDATSAVEMESGVSDVDGRWESRHRTCFGGIMR